MSIAQWRSDEIATVELRELLAWHTHELTQPIAAMGSYIGAAQRLLGATAESRVTTALGRGLAQIDRIRTTIGQVAQHFPDDNSGNPDIIEIVSHLASRYGVVFSQANSVSQSFNVCLDEVELLTVLYHLIRNATEACDQASAVAVSVSTDENWAVITIKNPSTAQPEDVWFEAFSGDKPGHLGLGLLIVKRLQARLNATLQLSNTGASVEARLGIPIASD